MPPIARALKKPPHFGLPVWAGLLPWLVFALGLKFLPTAAPALALATGLLLAWVAQTPLNPLDIGILAYFLALAGLALSAFGQTLSPAVHFALCPALLAVAAAASVVFRRPFTYTYAYPYTPGHLRDQPAFLLAHQWISLLWTVGFAGAALTITLLPGAWNLSRGIAILAFALIGAATGSALIGGWFHYRTARTIP
jgi:hypothetical protein